MDDVAENELKHVNKRLDEMQARMDRYEARIGTAVMAILVAAVMLIWEPLKRIVTGGGQ